MFMNLLADIENTCLLFLLRVSEAWNITGQAGYGRVLGWARGGAGTTLSRAIDVVFRWRVALR